MQLKLLANLVLQLTEQLITNQIIEEYSLIMKRLVEQLVQLEFVTVMMKIGWMRLLKNAVHQ